MVRRVVAVTGASGGVGRAAAVEFARRGDRVERQCASLRPYLRNPIMHTARPMTKTTTVATTAATTRPRDTSMSSV